jgi:hypothetical protein
MAGGSVGWIMPLGGDSSITLVVSLNLARNIHNTPKDSNLFSIFARDSLI